MKQTTAWTVKTKTGIITPSWIFDNREDAEEFKEKLEDYTHKYFVVPVWVMVIQEGKPTPTEKEANN